MDRTSKEAKELLQSQLKEWDLARINFEALNRVKTKEFPRPAGFNSILHAFNHLLQK